MFMGPKALALAALALAGCGGGGSAFEDQQVKVDRLRALADARCMCLMTDPSDKRCNFTYDDERKGLAATPIPPSEYAIVSRGACFTSLEGQCVVEDYQLRGGGAADQVCSQSDAIALNELHDKVLKEDGMAAADAAAKQRIAEIRTAWRAR